ncbi:hypothetical protein CRG98_047901, partial [Punica granatum]
MPLLSVSSSTTPIVPLSLPHNPNEFPSFHSQTVSIPCHHAKPNKFYLVQCRAAKSQTGPVKKRQSSSAASSSPGKRKKKKGK